MAASDQGGTGAAGGQGGTGAAGGQGGTSAAGGQGGTGTPSDQDDNNVDPIQYEATANAYYESVAGRASAARSRSQAGFAIVSAISGFVVAAAFTTQIDQAPGYTKWPAFLGVGFWVLSAGLFLRASIVQPRPEKKKKGEPRPKRGERIQPVPRTRRAFVNYVSERANAEAKLVSEWVVGAGVAAGLALALTMFTVGTVVFFPAGPAQTTATVTVTEPYLEQFLAQCQAKITHPTFNDLVGTLDVASLNSHFVSLDIAPGLCGDHGSLEIPRSAVLQVEEYPRCSNADLRSIEDTPPSRKLSSGSTSKFVKSISTSAWLGRRSIAPQQSASGAASLPTTFDVDCGRPFTDIFRGFLRFFRLPK